MPKTSLRDSVLEVLHTTVFLAAQAVTLPDFWHLHEQPLPVDSILPEDKTKEGGNCGTLGSSGPWGSHLGLALRQEASGSQPIGHRFQERHMLQALVLHNKTSCVCVCVSRFKELTWSTRVNLCLGKPEAYLIWGGLL